MKCLILCAGYNRDNEEIEPKSLKKINNTVALNLLVEKIDKIDAIDRIYVVTNGKNYEKFLNWSKDINNKKINIINDNTTSPNAKLGAIGDIKYTLNYENIDDDLFIIAGDAIYDFDFKDIYNVYTSKKAAIVAVKKINKDSNVKQYGIIEFNDDNKVVYMKEKSNEFNKEYMSLALYIYPKETIRLFDYYLSEGNKTTAPGYFLEYLYNIIPVYACEINGNYTIIN